MLREKVLKPAETAQFVLIGFMLVMLLLIIDKAHAAPAAIALSCTAPTTRTDGSALAATDLGLYHWVWDDAGAAAAAEFSTSTTCAVTFTIAVGTCVKAGSAFTVYATDKDGLKSDIVAPPFTLGADLCTPKPKPAPPAAVKGTVIPAS